MASFNVQGGDAELVGDALTRHLLGRRSQGGESLGQVRELYGTTTRAQTSAMARALAESDEYGGSRRYASTRRRLERYETGAGERRRADPALVALLRRLGLSGSVGPMLRDGLLMRVRATIRVSRNERVHTMPANAGGRANYQRIEPGALGGVAEAWIAGRTDDAGELLTLAFFDAYGLDPAEVGPIEWVEIREGAERRGSTGR